MGIIIKRHVIHTAINTIAKNQTFLGFLPLLTEKAHNMPIITKDLQERHVHRNCATAQIGRSFSGRYQYYV